MTLEIASGVATAGTLTTTVELATDIAFATIIRAQTVSPDVSGHITVALDHLDPATTYYWRVTTRAGDNESLVSVPQSFSIGPLLVIEAPKPIQPLTDTFPHKRPTFIVVNAAHTGPDANLTYRFEVASDIAFTNVVASSTVGEGASQTSFTPGADLSSGVTYYWRAQARDATKDVVGGYSAAQVFTTVNPDDGSFPYTLHVHCSTRFGSNYDAPQSIVDVAGENLRLALPAFNLQLTRAGKRLSGLMEGRFTFRTPYVLDIGASRTPVPYQWQPVGSANVSGEAAPDGTLSGTFEGYAVVGYTPEVHECIGPFSWALTPH